MATDDDERIVPPDLCVLQAAEMSAHLELNAIADKAPDHNAKGWDQ